MEREAELKINLGKMQSELYGIQNKRKIEENKKYAGKFFKYKNTDGGNHKPWWLYLKITGSGIYLKAYSFQHTSMDYFEIRKDDYIFTLQGYIEITEKEFLRARREFDKKIDKIR